MRTAGRRARGPDTSQRRFNSMTSVTYWSRGMGDAGMRTASLDLADYRTPYTANIR